jgi:hypothetical protein
MMQPLASAEAIAGLLLGLAALAIGLRAALGRRRTRAPATATVGLLFAAAVALGLRLTLGLPGGLVLGLVLLAGAGVVGGRAPRGWLAPALAVLAAWLIVARSGLTAAGWMQALVGAAIVAGSFLLADFDARWRGQGLGPVLLAISAAGIYSTVPDTEAALVALAAALPLALLGWPWPLGSLGRAGAYAAAGTLLYVVASGGSGRGSAVVGGVACLGLLAVEPVARLLDRRHRSILACLPGGRWSAVAAAVAHTGLVYIAARVAGLRATVAVAVTIALVELAVAVVLALAVTAARSGASPTRKEEMPSDGFPDYGCGRCAGCAETGDRR